MSTLKAYYLVGDCASINTSHRPTQSAGKLQLLVGNFSLNFRGYLENTSLTTPWGKLSIFNFLKFVFNHNNKFIVPASCKLGEFVANIKTRMYFNSFNNQTQSYGKDIKRQNIRNKILVYSFWTTCHANKMSMCACGLQSAQQVAKEPSSFPNRGPLLFN